MDVWSKLWDSDRGRHILPFYGWCQTDGPYPYVVSPWQANGTAIDYVKKNAFINHKQLVLGIARGVEVLHTMNPPIIHGEIKGEHIQVGATGNPLLSDFGLSKVRL
jgi:serine/threonine protein kinase